jgi:uncharacterized protein involved in type VI secretion and phage assembly
MNDSDTGCPTFYGKFRGIVSANNDPDRLGRIRAKVQDVLGDRESGWALPALPYAGDGVGLYLIPPVNAFVWIEFEHGDPDYPIWTGCFWGGRDRLPGSPTSPDVKVLKTESATITIDDKSGKGSVKIETGNLKIVMDSQGIELSNGSQTVKLSSSNVSINNGALEVM